MLLVPFWSLVLGLCMKQVIGEEGEGSLKGFNPICISSLFLVRCYNSDLLIHQKWMKEHMNLWDIFAGVFSCLSISLILFSFLWSIKVCPNGDIRGQNKIVKEVLDFFWLRHWRWHSGQWYKDHDSLYRTKIRTLFWSVPEFLCEDSKNQHDCQGQSAITRFSTKKGVKGVCTV